MMKRALTLSLTAFFLAVSLWVSAPFSENAQAAPTVPTGFQVKAYSASQINLSWNAVLGATSYQVYRSIGASSTYTRIAIVTTRSYKNTGLTAATRYNYKVRAVKSGSIGAFTAVKTVYTKPATPTGLVARTISTSQIDLSWNAVTGATSYQVYRSYGASTNYIRVAIVTTPQYSNKGLAVGTRYNYKVRAVKSGNYGNLSTAKTAYTKPAIPTGLTAITISTAQINLSWNAVIGATSYQVYRSTGASTYYERIAIVTRPNYNDTNCVAGTRYTYKVRAVKSGNMGGFTAAKTAYTRPAAPTGVTATKVSETEIRVNWNTVQGATRYNVYRVATGRLDYINTAYSTVLVCTGLTEGRYIFVVAAVAGSEEGPISAESNDIFLDGPPPDAPTGVTATKISETQIQVNWNAVTGAIKCYAAYASFNGGPYNLAGVVGPTSRMMILGGLPKGTYRYKVSAITDDDVESSLSAATATITLAGPITTPTEVTAIKVNDTRIHVTWKAVVGATGYKAYMSVNGGTFSSQGIVATSTCQWDPCDLTPGTYSFKISAVSGSNESAPSAATATITLSEPTYTIEDGRYRLVNTSSGLNLNGYDGSSSRAWWVIAAAGDGSQEQIFTFQRQTDGTYKISIERYGRVLTADGGLFAGANMITAPDSGAANQRFVLTKKYGDSYCISPASNKGLAVGQTDTSVYANRYSTALMDITSPGHYQWTFEKIEETSIEKAHFPMTNMNISQGAYGSYSHSGLNAIDICGKDSGIEDLFMPFTGKVVAINKAEGNVVWIVSVDPVQFANGTVDYLTIMLAHDWNIDNLYNGLIIPKGTVFYQEGEAGNAQGNHVHMECAQGKNDGSVNYFTWTRSHWVYAYNALYLLPGTNRINDRGYPWKVSD